MNAALRWLRVAAGVAVLGVLALIGAHLLPHYLNNLELQRALEDLVSRPENRTKPDDLLRVSVAERAARLGLPVRPGQVRVRRSSEQVRVEVRYFVPVDLPLYTVDLHFSPAAGR